MQEARKAEGKKGSAASVRPSSARDTVCDWVRLIATVYVVIGHSAYLTMSSVYGGVAWELPEQVHPLYNSTVFTWFRWLSGWVYGFHMPLFFMLSGAVLALKALPDFDTFTRSKAKRLLFPYFVWGWCFMFPVKRLGGYYDSHTVLLAMKSFLSGGESGHLWFLTALFWCQIVFCLLYKGLRRAGIKSGYLLLLCAGSIQLLGKTFIPADFDLLGMRTGLTYVFYFAAGYQFRCMRRSHEKWDTRKTVSVLILIFCIECLNYNLWTEILDGFFLVLAGSFFTFLLANLCSRFLPGVQGSRAWQFVIRNLFYVYLVHDPLEYIILRFTMRFNLLLNAGGCVLYLLMRTAGVFLAGLCMGELIRKGRGCLRSNSPDR